MGAVLQPPVFVDAEAFLAWEETQAERHEYVDGMVYAMVGARATHQTIVLNAAFWLKQVLRGSPCRVYIEGLKLHINAVGDFLYPDVMVTCDPRDRQPGEDRCVAHPWLVVEVLSDGTAAYDRGRQFERCRRIDTLTHYLLVEQDRLHADLFCMNGPESDAERREGRAAMVSGRSRRASAAAAVTLAASARTVPWSPPRIPSLPL